MAHLGDGFVPLQEESVVAYERWDGGEREGEAEGERQRQQPGRAATTPLSFSYGDDADDAESQLRRDEPSVYRN